MTRLAGAAATAAVAVGLLAASARGAPPAAVATPVAITVVTDDVTPSGCAPRLREVLAEQLAGVGAPLTWWCRATGEPDAPLRGTTSAAGRAAGWESLDRRRGSARGPRDSGTRRRRERPVRGPSHSARRWPRRDWPRGDCSHRPLGDARVARWQRRHAVARPGRRRDSSWGRPSASGGGAPRAPPATTTPPPPPAAPATGTPRTTQPRAPWHPIVTLGPAWSVLLFSPQVRVVHELALSAGLAAGSFGLWADAGVPPAGDVSDRCRRRRAGGLVAATGRRASGRRPGPGHLRVRRGRRARPDLVLSPCGRFDNRRRARRQLLRAVGAGTAVPGLSRAGPPDAGGPAVL